MHDQAPVELLSAVDHGLDEANRAAAPLHEVRALASIAHDDAGAVVGGAVGRTWGVCAELQQLWVAPTQRRQGLGTRLVGLFETHAAERGCTLVYLQTFSFQAPALYARLGYETVHRIAGFGHGIEQQWMVKRLAAR